MTPFKRKATFLLLSSATLALGACGGADDVASPGEGNIVVIPPPPPPPPPPAPTPAPAPTPTPTPPPPPPPPPPPVGPASSCPSGTTDVGVLSNRRNCRLPNDITTNLSLRNLPGTIYSFTGRVNVGADVGGDGAAAGGRAATLSVDPGVIVVAFSGADFILVNRGSQMIAEGTPTNPIIFTSRQNIDGTATENSSNQWGGIVLAGRAPISNCNTQVAGGSAGCQQLIEGTGSGAFYGGNVPTDSSGSLRYVQIRFTGFSLREGDELQGLTTGGVGSGTSIQFIQVHNSGDDGIEVFGGRQNMRNLVISGADDDSLDTDFGYKGFIQFVIAVQRSDGSGDTMIEADSNQPGGDFDFLPRQNTRLANFTFVQRRTGRSAILLRGGTDYGLFNGVVVGPTNCLDVDQAETVQAANTGLDEAGPPEIRSVAFACPTFADPDADDFEAQSINGSRSSGNNQAFTSTLTGTFINGANETAFPAFAGLVALSSFFTNTNYIGAVRDANDTWFRGWTCNSSYVTFGSPFDCTAVPQNTATTTA